jgi:hypothetical protein
MGKVRIDKDDKSRILLTELLPYEVPMLFSNEGFYTIFKKHGSKFFEANDGLSKGYGIPFNFEIGKSNSGDTRVLSIIHPKNQLEFIPLYTKYDTLMIHQCSKSPFSLRKISKVAKYYYSPDFVYDEDSLKSSELEVEPDTLDVETKYLKSYFIYKPIDLIYKFYEKFEYQRLEQRFSFLMELDISKCFYHIYTHTITWAVKNKESAKKNIGLKSFENTFDKIMRLANYNETNGIIVGPEISRIFAEIILQQVDVDVLGILENKNKFKYGVDFEVRRYVDDYFIFANDEKILEEIKVVFQQKLSFYKLYLNPAKSDIKKTPFLSNIAVGKWELNKTLREFYQKYIIQENVNGKIEKHLKKIVSPYSDSGYFIKEFQCIVKRNGLTYDLLSKEIIRYSKSQLIKIFKDESIEKNDEIVEKFLLMFFDVVFYAYSLFVNANTTFKVSQMIVLTCKFLSDRNPEIRDSISSKIFKESNFILTNIQRKSKCKSIDTLNLIISLKKLGCDFLFNEKRLRELFNIDKNEKVKENLLALNYFEIVVLLYYIDIKVEYNDLRSDLENVVLEKFRIVDNPFDKSEYTLLFFDFICCPFVKKELKMNIVKSAKYFKNNVNDNTIEMKIREIEKQKRWFMDWDIDIDLEKVLKKKEWGTSY